jgi:hypothetical protein
MGGAHHQTAAQIGSARLRYRGHRFPGAADPDDRVGDATQYPHSDTTLGSALATGRPEWPHDDRHRLILASGLVSAQAADDAWAKIGLTIAVSLAVWRTTWNPLWLLAVGAVLGAARL